MVDTIKDNLKFVNLKSKAMFTELWFKTKLIIIIYLLHCTSSSTCTSSASSSSSITVLNDTNILKC